MRGLCAGSRQAWARNATWRSVQGVRRVQRDGGARSPGHFPWCVVLQHVLPHGSDRAENDRGQKCKVTIRRGNTILATLVPAGLYGILNPNATGHMRARGAAGQLVMSKVRLVIPARLQGILCGPGPEARNPPNGQAGAADSVEWAEAGSGCGETWPLGFRYTGDRSVNSTSGLAGRAAVCRVEPEPHLRWSARAGQAAGVRVVRVNIGQGRSERVRGSQRGQAG